jgi:SOS-response transcriptional repressor LexA
MVAEHMFEKRLEILKYLARRADKAGAPPSVREIGRAVGLKSARPPTIISAGSKRTGTWSA